VGLVTLAAEDQEISVFHDPIADDVADLVRVHPDADFTYVLEKARMWDDAIARVGRLTASYEDEIREFGKRALREELESPMTRAEAIKALNAEGIDGEAVAASAEAE
jgi:hypothetical protein